MLSNGYVYVLMFSEKEVNYKGLPVQVYPSSSCKGRCGHDYGIVNCHCDSICDHFRDCCFDYHALCYHQPSNDTEDPPPDPSLFSCYWLNIPLFKNNVGLVDKCPLTFNNEIIRQRCSQFDGSNLSENHGVPCQ